MSVSVLLEYRREYRRLNIKHLLHDQTDFFDKFHVSTGFSPCKLGSYDKFVLNKHLTREVSQRNFGHAKRGSTVRIYKHLNIASFQKVEYIFTNFLNFLTRLRTRI